MVDIKVTGSQNWWWGPRHQFYDSITFIINHALFVTKSKYNVWWGTGTVFRCLIKRR